MKVDDLLLFAPVLYFVRHLILWRFICLISCTVCYYTVQFREAPCNSEMCCEYYYAQCSHKICEACRAAKSPAAGPCLPHAPMCAGVQGPFILSCNFHFLNEGWDSWRLPLISELAFCIFENRLYFFTLQIQHV